MAWSINEVARLSGVSSRTLRYYHEVGLLAPESTEFSGRRLYGQLELLRLQEILVLRELGLPLDSIREVLEGDEDRGVSLGRHLEWLRSERERIESLIGTVERTLEEGDRMSPDEIFEGIRHNPYEGEARGRWGDDVVEASKERLEKLTPEEIERLRTGFDEVHTRVAALHAEGAPVDDPRVLAAIREHYEIVSLTWTPDADAYRALGRTYVEDPRFRKNIGKGNDEMVEYLADVMAEFADTELTPEARS